MNHHRDVRMCLYRQPMAWAALLAGLIFTPAAASAQVVSGVQAQWQPTTLIFDGPSTSETDANNPFLNYRLDVVFTPPGGGTPIRVPGYYAGDGNGGDSGNKWRAHFTPDQAGNWTYEAVFYDGNNVAVADVTNLPTPSSAVTGSGSLPIAPRDPNAPGFLSKGRLAYVGEHYLQTLGDGKFWIKSGADSPENLLGYSGYDNTPTFKHQYAPHRGDWQSGDPNWSTTNGSAGNVQDGKNIIGALNYLSAQGVNSVYFLPMNIGGDGKDTHPFSSTTINHNGSTSNDNTRYDISKLGQWEQTFAHAQEKGLMLHFVLNEAEAANKKELDDATLGTERKLFYREMIARFSHHNALQWNLSEEYNYQHPLTEATVREWADHIASIDPYDHPTTVHNYNVSLTNTWHKLLGEERWDLTSLQQSGQYNNLGDVVEDMRARSADAGRKLAIMIDEPGTIHTISAPEVRKRMTWDILLSGGGVEWFASNADQSLENFRTYEAVYQQTAIARRFLEENTRFWEMTPADALVRGEDSAYGGAEVFAILGEQYAIYLPNGSNDDNNGGPPELDLRGFDDTLFSLRWFNPRTGLFTGDPVILMGGDWASIGYTPDGQHNTTDWAALVTSVPEPTAVIPLLGGVALLARRAHK